MEGYYTRGGKLLVNTSWWMQQWHQGEEDRRAKIKQDAWATYMQYYRNEYAAGIYPKNMLFVMARTMVPRIYYRNPKISIVPRMPGPQQQAFSKILERVDNILVDAMNLKVEMKRMVNASFFQSMGVMKLLFGAEFAPTPIAGLTETPVSKLGMRPEYRPSIVRNMPYVKNIPTQDFVMAEGIQEFEDSFFYAHRIVRYWDDLENDERFPEFKKYAKKKTGVTSMGDKDPLGTQDKSRRMVELYEFRDRRTRKVILLAPDVMPEGKPLLFSDDELQTPYSSPFYIFTPNIDVEHPYGVSDADILICAQEQLNDIKTKIHQHARVSIVKWMSEKNAITVDEAEKLLNENVGTVVQVANARGLTPIESHHIPAALLKQEQSIMEDIRELVGFSRNSMAQFQAKSHGPTATEVSAVNNASDLRIDERRDMIADNIVTMFKDIHKVIFRHWTEPQVVKILGENGLPLWVEFTGRMLEEGSYDVLIEPDSAVPETREVRESRASRLYQELVSNPHIDGQKLTRYRLHETPGVAMDDLMKNEEVAPGGNVVSMDQYVAQQGQSGKQQQVG